MCKGRDVHQLAKVQKSQLTLTIKFPTSSLHVSHEKLADLSVINVIYSETQGSNENKENLTFEIIIH